MSASMAEVLAKHQWMAASPDPAERCTCGIYPAAQTDKAMAAHQAEQLAANGYGKLDAPSRELKFLRGERKTLSRELDSFESKEHTTVTIKYLRRFFGRRPE